MIRILFLCVHNSARSQLAEGLLRKMAGEGFEVASAGSEPSSVNPYALRILQDEGIDTSAHYSKPVQEFLNQPFDYLITLCDDEICPVFPGALRRLHWAMADPAAVQGDSETKLEAFRKTADELQLRLTEFLAMHERGVSETLTA
jgi:arsenate reductase (thioredoxin)